jgi:hypothetical protein
MLVADRAGQGFLAENWGKMGAGNQYIQTKIWECDAKYKFTPDDWIFVAWTTMTRDDLYYQGQWYHSAKPKDQHLFKDHLAHFDPLHYVQRDTAIITSTQLALQEIGVHQRHWSILPYLQDEPMSEQLMTRDVLEAYGLNLDYPPMTNYSPAGPDNFYAYSEGYRVMTHDNEFNPKAKQDLHPMPNEHYAYILTNLAQTVPWFDTQGAGKILADLWQKRIYEYATSIDLDTLGWASPRVDQW